MPLEMVKKGSQNHSQQTVEKESMNGVNKKKALVFFGKNKSSEFQS